MWGATMLMLTENRGFNAINRAFPYLGRGCIVAALSFATTEAWVLANWTTAPYVVVRASPLNQISKADRLPLRIERADRELPVGCESVVSPIVPSPLTIWHESACPDGGYHVDAHRNHCNRKLSFNLPAHHRHLVHGNARAAGVVKAEVIP
jgi:hypothetical protein